MIFATLTSITWLAFGIIGFIMSGSVAATRPDSPAAKTSSLHQRLTHFSFRIPYPLNTLF